MKLFLFISILFLSLHSINSFAQSDSSVYFLDTDFNSSPKEKAVYVCFGVKEAGRIKFTAYNLATEILVIEGYFTDLTLAVKQGYFIYYDSLGNKTSEGQYSNNKEDGLWLSWRSDFLEDSSHYENGELVTQVSFNSHSNGSRFSRTFTDNRKKESFITTWRETGELASTHIKTVDSSEGIWYYRSGKIYSVEKYYKNKTNSKKFYKEDGTEMSNSDLQEQNKENERAWVEMNKKAKSHQPKYPGGDAGFQSFLQHSIKFPQSFREQMAPGEVIKVSFKLNEDGFAHDIKVLQFQNHDLQQAVIQAFRFMQPWNMNGHKHFGPIIYSIKVSRF